MILLGTILSATACALPIDVSSPASESIYDCDRHMKRLFQEDWQLFNKLQGAFSNYSGGPLKRVQEMEQIIKKHSPDTVEVIQTNVFKNQMISIARVKSFGIFELYTITDLDRPVKQRLQDLLLIYHVLEPRFKEGVESRLRSVIPSWNKLGDFLDSTYGQEVKNYVINAVRIVSQSEGFLEDSKVAQSLVIYEIVDCYVRNAVKKAFRELYSINY